jgi:hypothetical protein
MKWKVFKLEITLGNELTPRDRVAVAEALRHAARSIERNGLDLFANGWAPIYVGNDTSVSARILSRREM